MDKNLNLFGRTAENIETSILCKMSKDNKFSLKNMEKFEKF